MTSRPSARAAPGAAGVIWITGRPASGKSTLARMLAHELTSREIPATILDSDEVRAILTPDPHYTAEERETFYRALAELSAQHARQGDVAIVAATSHSAAYRRWASQICPHWFLVYARCPLEVCEARDPKGLYRQARADEKNTLPGIGVSYEEPADADYVIDTDAPVTAAQARALVQTYLARVLRGNR